MARGARQLTKAEKEKLKLYALIDRHQWLLTGTLVPKPRGITPIELKVRVDAAIKPKAIFAHNRNMIVLNANVWAEQIIAGEEDEQT